VRCLREPQEDPDESLRYPDKSRDHSCSDADTKMPKPDSSGLGIFLKILVYDFNSQFTTLIVGNSSYSRQLKS